MEIVKYLDTQGKIDAEAKSLLQEYVKNNTTVNVTLMTHPAIKMGQTVRLVDNVNDIDRNYMVESVNAKGFEKTLILTYYP